MLRFGLIALFIFIGSVNVKAQGMEAFKDSSDGKFDLSDWVLEAHGFIPVPMLITEPALGGIGGALFPIFISRNTPYIDTVDNEVILERVRPDIYGAGAAYTANGSWLVAGAAIGVVKSIRAHYRLITAYADINLEFYREIPGIGEKSFEFNIQTIPVAGQLIKQLRRGSHWYAGLDYLYMKTELQRTNAEFHAPDEIKADVSRLGILVDYDHRDNIFTPDKGFRWNTMIASSGTAIGSDYDYTYATMAGFGYFSITNALIAGVRADYQEVWGDAPFYLLPYISMRGIPVARYQGNITALAETEWRWDIVPRWSILAFGGAGKAINEWNEFESANWRPAGGVGGRYLVARKLKLRMGLDIARGPEQWAYYMVFGTSWVK
jgi:hypothetical protein